jgi:hypothetical protein
MENYCVVEDEEKISSTHDVIQCLTGSYLRLGSNGLTPQRENDTSRARLLDHQPSIKPIKFT